MLNSPESCLRSASQVLSKKSVRLLLWLSSFVKTTRARDSRVRHVRIEPCNSDELKKKTESLTKNACRKIILLFFGNVCYNLQPIENGQQDCSMSLFICNRLSSWDHSFCLNCSRLRCFSLKWTQNRCEKLICSRTPGSEWIVFEKLF